MQKQLLNCSVLFLTFPCCCGSWSEGHVVIPATTEMTTKMDTRAWLMSSMLLQWDRLKCWHSGLHFDHQNWLESWQPAVICNDLQLISLTTFPSPWSTETAPCTAVSVLVQQQSFCLIFNLMNVTRRDYQLVHYSLDQLDLIRKIYWTTNHDCHK